MDARENALALAYIGVSVLYLFVMPFIAFFYLIDTLYAERKERHILFWKSLPTTDAETVIAKVLTASLVIPFCFAVFMFASYLMFLLIGGFELPKEVSVLSLIWKPAPILKMFLTSLYALLIMSLWFLPFTGWFLLSGSLIKRIHPFIVALVTPLVLMIFEGIFFQTSYLSDWVSERLVNWMPASFDGIKEGSDFDFKIDGETFETGNVKPWTYIAPLKFLSNVNFWIGALIGSAFIAGAIYIRRFRDDS